MRLRNFGGNVEFDPSRLVTPRDRAAVVAHLEACRGRGVRAIGSLHSWSEVAATQGVVFDLKNLTGIELHTDDDGRPWVEVEAGCTVDALLEYLRRLGDYTLPVYGIIGKQRIAGAISTATHGSGRSSMSHYVTRMSVAAFDSQTGHARVYNWAEGEDLRAARCGAGCVGIVLSVGLPVEPEYLLEERTVLFDRIESVLECEREYPRQQFYLIPWSWKWLAQLRRPVGPPPATAPGGRTLLRRWFTFLKVDVALHGVVRLLAGYLCWPTAIRWFYRSVVPRSARAGTIVDRSRNILQMRHDLYTHVEMELLVPADHVAHAAALVEWVLRCCGGEVPDLPAALSGDRFGFDVIHEIKPLRGCYVHDYLVTFRQVLADDTLISMTGGTDVAIWYAISFISYQRDRRPFLRMARFLAASMASAYRARPHWGKICPLDADEIARLYPTLARFRTHCETVDPRGVFVNDFARLRLGFQ
jgi:FAD/FMN-containing dehydrogenase